MKNVLKKLQKRKRKRKEKIRFAFNKEAKIVISLIAFIAPLPTQIIRGKVLVFSET